jgi:hypothetical protein
MISGFFMPELRATCAKVIRESLARREIKSPRGFAMRAAAVCAGDTLQNSGILQRTPPGFPGFALQKSGLLHWGRLVL